MLPPRCRMPTLESWLSRSRRSAYSTFRRMGWLTGKAWNSHEWPSVRGWISTRNKSVDLPKRVCDLNSTLKRELRNILYIGNPNLLLTEVDKDFWKGFIVFLKTCTFNNGKKTLSATTCRILVDRLTAALTKAVSEGLIDRNPFKLLDAKEKP